MSTASVDHPIGVAWLELATALDELSETGRRTPCQVDVAPFYADEPAERREAAAACLACPVRGPCATYAETAGEPFGVWGGRDRAPRSYRRKEADQ